MLEVDCNLLLSLCLTDKKNFGFVIKRFFPLKQKVSVLCASKGKIELLTNPLERCKQLWPGMLIAYNCINKGKNIFFAEQVEILNNIFNEKDSKIYWIHHILELCYYFVPMHDPCAEIFDYLYHCMLFINNENFFSSHIKIIKKIYLLKFFVLIGFYPQEELLVYLNFYKQITCMSIDFNDLHKVEFLNRKLSQLEKVSTESFDSWIVSCLSSHPQFKNFKTLNFKDEF